MNRPENELLLLLLASSDRNETLDRLDSWDTFELESRFWVLRSILRLLFLPWLLPSAFMSINDLDLPWSLNLDHLLLLLVDVDWLLPVMALAEL